ncbi:hypothetical protein [Streptomyces sp. MS191]|uniref:hypothetical protein n=1 Tax=Streptomyces sp. ms191 TaxID=1827978 RepID=UPI0011CD796C|nr:hypothetical protein [Streptomyces sp. ms191]
MNTERASALLLVAMYQRLNGVAGTEVEVNELPGWEDLGDERLLTLTAHLEQAGMAASGPKASGMSWCLSPAGVVRAENLLEQRNRPVIRYDTALNGLITAATDKFPKHRLEVQNFLSSEHAQILDDVLTLDEIFSAIEYLENEQLVRVERDASRPTAITLTPLGRKCGWNSNVDVQGFLAGQQPVGIQTSWSVEVYGGANQIGPGNVQNNNFGLNAEQVMKLVREVKGLVPSMDVPEPVRERITEDVEALEREAEREEPQSARMRRLIEGLRESLDPSKATTVGAATTLAQSIMSILA